MKQFLVLTAILPLMLVFFLQFAMDQQNSARVQAVSDLAYFPVVINCMAVLLNFIYVAYFIAQKDQLGMLMG